MLILSNKSRTGKYIPFSGYKVPDPTNSMEDYQRLHNDDLRNMSHALLIQEETLVKIALAHTKRDRIIFACNEGFITIRGWLLSRILEIMKIKDVARRERGTG